MSMFTQTKKDFTGCRRRYLIKFRQIFTNILVIVFDLDRVTNQESGTYMRGNVKVGHSTEVDGKPTTTNKI